MKLSRLLKLMKSSRAVIHHYHSNDHFYQTLLAYNNFCINSDAESCSPVFRIGDRESASRPHMILVAQDGDVPMTYFTIVGASIFLEAVKLAYGIRNGFTGIRGYQ
jgi:hypothetical protein